MRSFVAVWALMLVLPCFSVNVASADIAVEPFLYHQDFETVELSAWASYPLWQDTAYDPNIRANTIIPGDPNISLVQIVTPYTSVDNYAGAQKELDMFLIPGSTISLRYYLKTQLAAEYIQIRIAAGPDGKADITIPSPVTNKWELITVKFSDFIRENPRLAGKDRFKVNALAVLAKFLHADPAMPIYFGLDDIAVNGARLSAFQFDKPEVFKLSEWKPYIAQKHYRKGDTFTVQGAWPMKADTVTLDVVKFTHHSEKTLSAELNEKSGLWTYRGELNYEAGLYLATLTAYIGGDKLSETEFTFYIAPDDLGGSHPRLWFDSEKKKWVENRLKSDRFKDVFDGILSSAKASREQVPLNEIVFDIDQFPDEDWLPTLTAWSGTRIGAWRNAVYNNALSYAFHGDREAGIYAKDLMVKLSELQYWLHPWMIKRGRHIYYPIGIMGMKLAMGYDLVYDLMSESDRKTVRTALMNNIVLGCHKGYVEDDLVTNNTSNWVAHITGGSLMCLAAMYGDGPDVEQVEPYFTGAVFKDYELIRNTLDRDGAYGEGYGYYNFSMNSWSESLPALENVFNVDISEKLNGSYKELIWASNITEKQAYYFGDSSGGLGPLTNWAWLLPKYGDPLLGWFYNFMKRGETFMDVLYETADVPRDDPFDENPVKLFRDVGTTVFKSGWDADDFIFVMRTGPFVNHQHIDQGTFWLSGNGGLFIEERHNSTYYLDPQYQSWYTQPVAHSTILIDNNNQSQRVGDALWHVDGFDDYASVTHFLDGEHASFSSGDIGKLYWGKVASIKRNVLYLKPDTVLMLDTVMPSGRDVDVTLLYQTQYLKDIAAGEDRSVIEKDDAALMISHLYPEQLEIKSVETPHYMYTLLREKPLEREGMLTVTARTHGNLQVIANMLTTTAGAAPHMDTVTGDGFVSGTIHDVPFAFTTKPNTEYETNEVVTDALAVTWKDNTLFVAKCTTLKKDGMRILDSQNPITCEITAEYIKYYVSEESRVLVGVLSRPSTLCINGTLTQNFSYQHETGTVALTLPSGEGMVEFAY
jgi:hypothetical protein